MWTPIGAIGDIVVPVGGAKQPIASSQFTLDLNLNSAAAADATSKFSDTIKVYDSLGTTHVLTVHFQKTGANQWSYNVTIPGEEISGGTAGTPFDISGASGTLTFGTDGQLTSPALGTPITYRHPGPDHRGRRHESPTGTPTPAGGSGRITQFGQPSAPAASSQNGSAAAQLIRVGLADGGKILAQYSDGQQVVVGQVAMASVRNPESLIAAGNNNYQVSARTATPGDRTAQYGRTRRYRRRRHRILHRGYRPRVHQSDRSAARLPGKFARHHDGRRTEPGNHQSEALGGGVAAARMFASLEWN